MSTSSYVTVSDLGLTTEELNQHVGYRLIVPSVVFMVVCPAFIGLRYWAQRIQHRSWGVDDWLVYPALVACWALQVSSILIVVKGGIGTSTEYWGSTSQYYVISASEIWLFEVILVYLLATCLGKLAILAIFLRILKGSTSHRVTIAILCTVIATWLGSTVAAFTECIPIQSIWDPAAYTPSTSCFEVDYYWQFLSVPNIVTDIAILVLPWPTVWKLHTSRIQKIQLSIVFVFGSFGLLTSILRFIAFLKMDLTGGADDFVLPLTWTLVEPSIYLICACKLTLRPVFSKLVRTTSETVSRATQRYTTQPSYLNVRGSFDHDLKPLDGSMNTKQKLYVGGKDGYVASNPPESWLKLPVISSANSMWPLEGVVASEPERCELNHWQQ